MLCNQRKHSKYTVCTTDSSLFPYYYITATCSPATLRGLLQAVLAFHLAFIYFRVPGLEPLVRNTRETCFVLCSIYVLAEEYNELYIVNNYRTLTFECTNLNTVLWLSVHRNSIVLPVALWTIQPLQCTQLYGQVQTCWPTSTEECRHAPSRSQTLITGFTRDSNFKCAVCLTVN